MTSPGRPKGTRVVVCPCGRRVAGEHSQRVTCPDCGRRVLVKPKERKIKKRVFITADPPKRSKK